MRSTRQWVLLLVFLITSVLTRFILIGVDVIDLDEAANLVGGREFLRGRLLYTDFAENKPPLIYLFYSFAQLLGRSMLPVRLLTALVVVPWTAYAASAFYRHDRRGVIAGFLFLVSSASFLGHDMLSTNCEILMILPGTWGLVMLRDETAAQNPFRCFAAGFLMGIAALFKYQSVFWLAALGVGIFFGNRGAWKGLFSRFVILAIAFAVPLLATYWLFAAWGGADGLLYWTISHNLVYTANPIPLQEAVGRAGANLLPFLLATAGLWWCCNKSMPHFRSTYRKRILFWLLILSIPPMFLGLRFFPHYFIQLYIPLALCAAPAAVDLLQKPLTKRAKIWIGYTALILVGFTAANGILYRFSSIYQETDPIYRKVAERLRQDRCYGNSTLFVWGFAPMFYYYADRPIASRFVVPQTSLTGYISGNLASVSSKIETSHLIRSDHWDLLLDDLQRNQATYMIDTAPAHLYRWHHYPIEKFPRLAKLIRENYEQLDHMDGVVLYRRRDCM